MDDLNPLELRGQYDRITCTKCRGSGYFEYSSTATWHGGVGGCAMTDDVCSKCWGSGMDEFPWPSHRDFEKMERGEPLQAPIQISQLEVMALKPKMDSDTT